MHKISLIRQSERTIQTLEDMLRAVVVDRGGSWETALPLIEFVYNNSFQAPIDKANFMHRLYGENHFILLGLTQFLSQVCEGNR